MVNVTDDQFNEIVNAPGKYLVLFSAEWCAPCKVLKPQLELVEKQFTEKYKFLRADIEINISNTRKFGIKNIPTVVLIEDGKEITRFVGSKNPLQIIKILEEFSN